MGIGEIIATILWLYFLVLLGRFVIDLVQMLSPDWRPKGVMVIAAEAIYTLTDPPLKALRKIIPPVKFGTVSIDLSFLILIIGLQILIPIVSNIGRSAG